ncbi:3070_t:CDS:1, partial [Ambispora gerdemannii]
HDEKTKKEMISDIEFDLKKKEVSEERLNQRLGVSDWREEIRKCSDSTHAIHRRSDLWDVIRNLQYEYTCANCGVKKEAYTAYCFGNKKCCS